MVTLQQLIYFRELATTEHLTRSAENLCIAQTTLSTTIHNLETQLSVSLFDRIGRNIKLNEAGKAYLSYVNAALTSLENGEKVLSDFSGNTKNPVTIAMSSSYVWESLIKGFIHEYPGYTIKQSDAGRDSFRSLLMEQQVDFVFCGTNDFSSAGLCHEIVYTDDIYLCVSQNHPLAGRREISLQEVSEESFIDLPKSSSFRHFCDKMFEAAGIQHHTVIECDYMLRGQLIEAGYGVGLTTNLSYWKNTVSSNCSYLLITDKQAVREISIFWNPKKFQTKQAKDFLNYTLKVYHHT